MIYKTNRLKKLLGFYYNSHFLIKTLLFYYAHFLIKILLFLQHLFPNVI